MKDHYPMGEWELDIVILSHALKVVCITGVPGPHHEIEGKRISCYT